jgi:hypothetical protein
VASLWSVSDESTQVLMEKFYTHLREGMSKAEALRAAQMEMIASGEYAHPYHWAAFGVTGDPGMGGVSPRPTVEATPEATLTSTPAPTAQKSCCRGVCPAVVLPLMMLGLMTVRRRK